MMTSLLESLPRELRIQIYEQLFPDQPIPAYSTARPSSLRRDGARTSVTILSVNQAIYSEALPILYGQTSFHAHISRVGVRMCCGSVLLATTPPSATDATPLRHIRRLHVSMTVLLTPWPQAMDAIAAHAALFASRLRARRRAARLASLHLQIEWANGGTNFPMTYPTPALARRLLMPFARLRSAAVTFGGVVTPRWDFGAMNSERLEKEVELFKEELRADILEGYRH